MMNDFVQWWMKQCILHVGYKLAQAKTDIWGKDNKDKEAALI